MAQANSTRVKISENGEDEIYIDCHPVNASGELLIKEPKSQIVEGVNSLTAKKLFKNPYFDTILGIVGFILIAWLINKGITMYNKR